MKKRLLTLLSILLCNLSIFGSDSIKAKLPHFIAVNAAGGSVFATNKFVSKEYRIPHYNAFSLKYGILSKGNSWEDYAYGLPTLGVGLYIANLHRKQDLGIPFSLFLFQGATLHQFNAKISLNYEFDLGASFNWKHFDPVDNPYNVAISSSVNVHAGANLFVKWRLSPRIDLNTGLGLTHFSNGATSLPNRGINMGNVFIELLYHFNREEKPLTTLSNPYTPPVFKKHIAHDLMLLVSTRETRARIANVGVVYTDRDFKVFGLSYAYMQANGRRYKWGPSVEITYDESSGLTGWREENPETHKIQDHIKLGKIQDRFSVGLSLKGELSMPMYSFFANMGYSVLHNHHWDKRLYQILGVKIYLKDNFFGTFGIRAEKLASAQYLFCNLGYTFEQEKKKRKKP